MLSARGWARLLTAAAAVSALSVIGSCTTEDAVFGPLDDTTPPVVNISSAAQSGDTLTVTVTAEDAIAVSEVITELRRPDQPTTEITAEGDTLILGRLVAVDTTRYAGRKVSVTATVKFLTFFLTTATTIEIRAVAKDASDNEGVDEATIVAGGGGSGGTLSGPQVSITSPTPNQTVRDGTRIRVGVQASDPDAGLAQLNVSLSGAASASETVQFSDFRTDVDTLLDFFIPDGAAGDLTISAEAINRNSISAFAQILVTVSQVVTGDTIPPIVSMNVSGGRAVRQDEPLRMEADDSMLVDISAEDRETAISRVGVTMIVRNVRSTTTSTVTIAQDSVFDPPISGTVPIQFALTPESLPASVFTLDDIPDTLFIEVTGWAFDDAPTPNCGATVDTAGAPNSLRCTSNEPIRAANVTGGLVRRLIVSGRTIGFPQGSLIADAAVDTLRELLYLSDFEFGVVRVFDLRNEQFVDPIPVGSEPWGLAIDNTQDQLLVANSGGTNISVVDLGPRTPGSPAVVGEVDRFQTQDIQVFKVEEDFDQFGRRIYPVTAFDYSDRPQFIAQAANGLILFSTRPALANQEPGTIREYDPTQREIRFFIDYADRASAATPQIQVVNADSVFGVDGSRQFKICDHQRGNPANAGCIFVIDSLGDARIQVDAQRAANGWDTDVFSDLVIESIGLQDTTFVAASGDRQFVAFGEGDTPDRPGRIIMYRSATKTITNSLQVTDLTGNAAQRVLGLALNNDGSLGVGRGAVAFFFDNTLRLLGTNNDVNPAGVGAALHPDHSSASFSDPDTRLSFLGSDDSKIEIVDTRFFDFKRGQVLIRDPIVGPIRATRRLPPDPSNVAVKLYGVTSNGVVVIQVRNGDINPL